jgi:death-on-curing protein
LIRIKRIHADKIISLHSRLISQSGGLDGIRDANLLDLSVNSPYHTFGNKRIGILAMMVFLRINGLPLACTDNELETLGWGLADGSIDEPELIEWIVSHS